MRNYCVIYVDKGSFGSNNIRSCQNDHSNVSVFGGFSSCAVLKSSMSIFEKCDEMFTDMTIKILEETIAKQSKHIKAMSEKFDAMQSDHRKEIKMIHDKNSEEINHITASHQMLLDNMKKEKKVQNTNNNSVLELLRYEIESLINLITTQEAHLKKVEREKTNALTSNIQKQKKISQLQFELDLKDNAVEELNNETDVLQELLLGEKTLSESKIAENAEIVRQLETKSLILKATQDELEKSNQTVVEMQKIFEQSKNEFKDNLLHLQDKIKVDSNLMLEKARENQYLKDELKYILEKLEDFESAKRNLLLIETNMKMQHQEEIKLLKEKLASGTDRDFGVSKTAN